MSAEKVKLFLLRFSICNKRWNNFGTKLFFTKWNGLWENNSCFFSEFNSSISFCYKKKEKQCQCFPINWVKWKKGFWIWCYLIIIWNVGLAWVTLRIPTVTWTPCTLSVAGSDKECIQIWHTTWVLLLETESHPEEKLLFLWRQMILIYWGFLSIATVWLILIIQVLKTESYPWIWSFSK